MAGGVGASLFTSSSSCTDCSLFWITVSFLLEVIFLGLLQVSSSLDTFEVLL